MPRPETETVVEAALDYVERGGLRLEKLRLLDIGTGSGALLLALLRELPNASGIGTDISAAALAVARANAERNNLAGRCTFVACNIADGVQGPFDIIVSNPPYVVRGDIATLAPEVRNFDPSIALDGGTDGLDFYRAIAGEARRLLAPGGQLIVELGMGQEGAVRTLFTKSGIDARRRAQRFGRNPARAQRNYRIMRQAHVGLPQSADLFFRSKKHLECPAETTSFPSTESTRDSCIAENP